MAVQEVATKSSTLDTPVITPKNRIKDRESQELVLAFSGPAGSGASLVIEETTAALEEAGYSVTTIKLSDLIKLIHTQLPSPKEDLSKLSDNNRYELLQNAGNEIREHFKQPEILAEIAISQIAAMRVQAHPEVEIDEIVPKREAYLIDQLKHPEEVKILRTVYGNMFYLIGVLCTYEQRKKRLCDEADFESHDAERIMSRDQQQNFTHGQKLDKTLQHSDFFIRNNHSNREALSKQLKRFIDLAHGKNGITPTQHEYAMYVAYAAGAKSACLSRQVGASITNPSGVIVATGCNDVPKAQGGLYTESDGELDMRCVNKEGGKCFNDHHKKKLKKDIENILIGKQVGSNGDVIDERLASDIANELYESTRLGGLIEFSRSIHAEMNAITSLAVSPSGSTKDAYLYTTTFPCHNCARHIITSGISKVFYIQPYEKSLATELHGDDICLDPSEDEDESDRRVKFIHFEGVAPAQYLAFFQSRKERKDDDGKATRQLVRESSKVTPQYLDKYMDLESAVARHVKDEINIEIPPVE